MLLPRLLTGTALAALGLGAIGLALYAQTKTDGSDPLVFEVASVKSGAVCPPSCGLVRPTVGNQGYHVDGSTVRTLLTIAYSVTDRQIAGGPSWMSSDRFSIEAKAARPHTNDELHVMLQHLLEERFQLKLRHEDRPENVWNMVAAKGGPKMAVHDPDDKDYAPIAGQMVKAPDGSVCPGIAGRNVTMNYFAFFLSRTMDRSVIDKTELPARYDVNLQFLPEGLRLGGDGGAAPAISPECADLFSALPRQLGLRLEAGKGPVEYLVVERLEKPTEN